ncbi:MAG: TRAP transporter small permease [Peptococcaceae bacterium]|nr:TRAP transporter small permease [Peptococcaceae bacterium]MDH7525965.1 TRAP transporter small permease [Peptococcaceae bacterium]
MEQAKKQTSFASMFESIDKGITFLIRLLFYISTFIVLPMIFVVGWGAISRYVFSKPFTGVLECTYIMLMLMVMMAGGNCQLTKSNVVMGMIVDRLSGKTQAIIDFFNYCICLIISVVLTYATIKQSIFISKTGTYTDVLHVPFAPLYFIIAIGWASIALASLLLVIRSIGNIGVCHKEEKE